MRIRKQLSTAYLGGSVLTAAIFGLTAESLTVFAAVFIVLLAFHLCERRVRPR